MASPVVSSHSITSSWILLSFTYVYRMTSVLCCLLETTVPWYTKMEQKQAPHNKMVLLGENCGMNRGYESFFSTFPWRILRFANNRGKCGMMLPSSLLELVLAALLQEQLLLEPWDPKRSR